MKKILFFLLVIITIIIFNSKNEETQETKELRGVYISYIEISKYLKDKDETTSKQNIIRMIENIKKSNLNTIVLQVRPSNDAIYYSKIYPISKYLSSDNYYPYDVLKFFIEESNKKNIKVIVWINPYRIRTTIDTSTITELSPAFKKRGSRSYSIRSRRIIKL